MPAIGLAIRSYPQVDPQAGPAGPRRGRKGSWLHVTFREPPAADQAERLRRWFDQVSCAEFEQNRDG